MRIFPVRRRRRLAWVVFLDLLAGALWTVAAIVLAFLIAFASGLVD